MPELGRRGTGFALLYLWYLVEKCFIICLRLCIKNGGISYRGAKLLIPLNWLYQAVLKLEEYLIKQKAASWAPNLIRTSTVGPILVCCWKLVSHTKHLIWYIDHIQLGNCKEKILTSLDAAFLLRIRLLFT